MGVGARASSAAGRTYLRCLRRDAAAILRFLGLAHCELSLLVCDDADIQRLNRHFRFKDKPTDVLSFAQDDDAGGVAAARLCRAAATPPAYKGRGGGEAPAQPEPPRLLGDVVISLETASRQAIALEQDTHTRLRTLMVHGVLHLLGYDHERSPMEARRMFAREREVAAALGQPRGERRAPRAALPAAGKAKRIRTAHPPRSRAR